MKKRVVGVVGLGHVGAHVAFNLGAQGIADEVVLVDTNEQKRASEWQDLFDSGSLLPHRCTYVQGSYQDLGRCDVIVNSVGKIELLRGGNTRNLEMGFTVPAVRSFVDKIMSAGFDGVIVNVTNPCDVVTREIARLSGLPRGRVFGTGTGLDSARLVSLLADKTGLDHKSVTAYMIGEHGQAQMALWSQVNLAGQPLDAWEEAHPDKAFDKAAMQKDAIDAGWKTFAGKFCTEYGISLTAARLVNTVLHDEKRVLAVSTELCGEYGEHDLFVGVPAVVGAQGVEYVPELGMTEEERAQFKVCCDHVRANVEAAAKL